MDLFGDFSTSTDNSLPPELGFSALKSEANLQKSGQPAQKEEDSALSVTQLTGLIKTMLEGSFSSVFISYLTKNFYFHGAFISDRTHILSARILTGFCFPSFCTYQIYLITEILYYIRANYATSIPFPLRHKKRKPRRAFFFV